MASRPPPNPHNTQPKNAGLSFAPYQPPRQLQQSQMNGYGLQPNMHQDQQPWAQPYLQYPEPSAYGAQAVQKSRPSGLLHPQNFWGGHRGQGYIESEPSYSHFEGRGAPGGAGEHWGSGFQEGRGYQGGGGGGGRGGGGAVYQDYGFPSPSGKFFSPIQEREMYLHSSPSQARHLSGSGNRGCPSRPNGEYIMPRAGHPRAQPHRALPYQGPHPPALNGSRELPPWWVPGIHGFFADEGEVLGAAGGMGFARRGYVGGGMDGYPGYQGVWGREYQGGQRNDGPRPFMADQQGYPARARMGKPYDRPPPPPRNDESENDDNDNLSIFFAPLNHSHFHPLDPQASRIRKIDNWRSKTALESPIIHSSGYELRSAQVAHIEAARLEKMMPEEREAAEVARVKAWGFGDWEFEGGGKKGKKKKKKAEEEERRRREEDAGTGTGVGDRNAVASGSGGGGRGGGGSSGPGGQGPSQKSGQDGGTPRGPNYIKNTIYREKVKAKKAKAREVEDKTKQAAEAEKAKKKKERMEQWKRDNQKGEGEGGGEGDGEGKDEAPVVKDGE